MMISRLLSLKMPPANPEPLDQWVIVWGGSTSVGSNAIQLAVAAGYSVVTTASPKNFEYVRSLGAALAFDYNSRDVVPRIVAALEGKSVVGALAIGAGSTDACMDILAHCRGRKFVASCSAPAAFDELVRGNRMTIPAILNALQILVRSGIRSAAKSRRLGVAAKVFDASSVIDNEVGRHIYRDYLGKALASRRFRPAPPPLVVGTTLQDIQAAFDIQRKGVSASKIVVAL